MSDGATHKIVNHVTNVVITGGAFLVTRDIVFTGAVFCGASLGTVITPDYDLNKKLPRSLITRLPVVRTLWRWFWTPYMLVMPHRSFFSHFPIVGTTIRAAYLLFGICGILWWCQIAFGWETLATLNSLIVPAYMPYYFVGFMAWCVQDFTHILLDFVF